MTLNASDRSGIPQRNAICSLPDSRIRQLGKRSAYAECAASTGCAACAEADGFLRRCRIRADRKIAAEQSEKETEESRLLAKRQAAAEEKEDAERRLESLRIPQQAGMSSPLRVHKAEMRLEKQRQTAVGIMRSCQLELEQLRIRTCQRQDGWEAAYKEIESLYLQGKREGKTTYENQ